MRVRVIGKGGKWGQVLAREVEALGHRVLADLDGETSDAVVFAVPPQVQEEIAPAWLKNGHPCFLEKPLALSKVGAQKIVEAAGSTIVAVDHLRPLAPSWIEFCRYRKREQQSVSSVHVGGQGPDRDWPIRHNANFSFGPNTFLWDYGPHALAYLLDYFDDEPLEVCASGNYSNYYLRAGLKCVEGRGEISVTSRGGVKHCIVLAGGRRYDYDSTKELLLPLALGAFFDAIEKGTPIPPTLSLSRAVRIVELLEEIELKRTI